MADHGLWWKFWTCALDDIDLCNLSIADRGRWAWLALIVKRQGSGGLLRIPSPARKVCAELELQDFAALCEWVKEKPGIDWRIENNCLFVAYRNWMKWQGDRSNHRVAAYRERQAASEDEECNGDVTNASVTKMLHSKKDVTFDHSLSLSINTGANKEEKNKIGQNGFYRFDEFWKLYPKRKSKGEAEKAWHKISRETKDRIIQILPFYVFSEDPQYIPHPATWLNRKCWEDEQIRRNPDIPKGATMQEEQCSTCHDASMFKDHKKISCPDCGRSL